MIARCIDISTAQDRAPIDWAAVRSAGVLRAAVLSPGQSLRCWVHADRDAVCILSVGLPMCPACCDALYRSLETASVTLSLLPAAARDVRDKGYR